MIDGVPILILPYLLYRKVCFGGLLFVGDGEAALTDFGYRCLIPFNRHFLKGIGIIIAVRIRLGQVANGQSPAVFPCQRVGLSRIAGVPIRIHPLRGLACCSFQVDLNGIRQGSGGSFNVLAVHILPDLVHRYRDNSLVLPVRHGNSTALNAGLAVTVAYTVPIGDVHFLEVIVIILRGAVLRCVGQKQVRNGRGPVVAPIQGDGLETSTLCDSIVVAGVRWDSRTSGFIIRIGNAVIIIVVRIARYRCISGYDELINVIG